MVLAAGTFNDGNYASVIAKSWEVTIFARSDLEVTNQPNKRLLLFFFFCLFFFEKGNSNPT